MCTDHCLVTGTVRTTQSSVCACVHGGAGVQPRHRVREAPPSPLRHHVHTPREIIGGAGEAGTDGRVDVPRNQFNYAQASNTNNIHCYPISKLMTINLYESLTQDEEGGIMMSDVILCQMVAGATGASAWSSHDTPHTGSTHSAHIWATEEFYSSQIFTKLGISLVQSFIEPLDCGDKIQC